MNTNIVRLIDAYVGTGNDIEWVRAVLYRLGMIPEEIEAGIEYWKKNHASNNPQQLEDRIGKDWAEGGLCRTNDKNNISEHKFMKNNFSLLELWNRCATAREKLNEMVSENGKLGYTALIARDLLENAMCMFPSETQTMSARAVAGFEVNESKVNPSAKYRIAKVIVERLGDQWLDCCKELCNYISESMKKDKWGYVAAQVMEVCEAKMNREKMYVGLYERLEKALANGNIETELRQVAFENEFWSSECKQVALLYESEKNANANEVNERINSNGMWTEIRMFTPALVNEKGEQTFNLFGKNYMVSEGRLMECKVSDERYNDCVNGLMLMHYNSQNESLDYYGANGKILEWSVKDDTIKCGDTDYTNMGSIALVEKLGASGLFDRRNINDLNILAKMFESKEMVYALDNIHAFRNDMVAGLYLTVLAVEESKRIYANQVDLNNGVNEICCFGSATEAVKSLKEGMRYDASAILNEWLVREGDENAKYATKREALTERINYLKEKRSSLVDKMASIPENIDVSPIKEAISLVENELKKNECELATCTCNGSTCACGTQGECMAKPDDCVVVKLAANGTDVWVNAAAFAAADADAPLTIIDPCSQVARIVKKCDLVWSMDTKLPQDATQQPTVAAPQSTVTTFLNDGKGGCCC